MDFFQLISPSTRQVPSLAEQWMRQRVEPGQAFEPWPLWLGPKGSSLDITDPGRAICDRQAGRTARCFRGRYKAMLVDRDAYIFRRSRATSIATRPTPPVPLAGRDKTGLTLRAIGDWLGGLHYSTVDQNLQRHQRAVADDPRLLRSFQTIKSRLDRRSSRSRRANLTPRISEP